MHGATVDLGVCDAAGAYIGEFRVSVSSFDAPRGDEADTYITGISATCYRRTQGLPHTQLQSIDASRATNETEYVFQNPANGFTTFEVTYVQTDVHNL